MYVFLRFVYILFYYYFFQIVIIYIVYFWGEHRWDGEESEVKSFLIYGQWKDAGSLKSFGSNIILKLL